MLTYDRRAPAPLLEALKPGGFAHSLVEYGRCGRFALDLQFRGYARKSGLHWVTLYAGLTKVLDLHFLPSRGFRLDVHKTWQEQGGWNLEWSSYREQFDAAEWRAVEDYIERVIPKVGERFMLEGAVQSAVSVFQSHDFTVIDREVAIKFSTQLEKDKVTKRLTGRLLSALNGPGPSWWENCPDHLGGECDALAVDKDGRLLAIEIKPAKASTTIPWAPIQVRHYADLLKEWASSASDAAEIINGMVGQRCDVGLIRSEPSPLSVRPEVIPVLAIERGASITVMDRLRRVHTALCDAGLDEPPLELYEVSLAGRLDRIEL